MEAFPQMCSPPGRVWKEGGDFVIAFGDAPPASETVMELSSCRYRKRCCEDYNHVALDDDVEFVDISDE